MFRQNCQVVSNQKVAPGHFVLTFKSDKISPLARPGQFVQIMCTDSCEPLLPRPFSFLTVSKKSFSILYQVVGKGTLILSKLKPNDWLWIAGPFGNGFSLDMAHPKIILVGGGVGIPPLYHLAQTLVKNKFSKKDIHVFLGARDKSLLLCEKDFKKLGVNIQVSTDNGSKGHKGFVTAILENFLKQSKPSYIHTCGPTPMLRAVSMVAQKYQTPCEVSVEVPMACGFGACLGCAIKLTGGRYAIACCQGPVFKAGEVAWE